MSAVGTAYAAAAFSTVYPQSSAPALVEEQSVPEWSSRDEHGSDAGKATPSGGDGDGDGDGGRERET